MVYEYEYEYCIFKVFTSFPREPQDKPLRDMFLKSSARLKKRGKTKNIQRYEKTDDVVESENTECPWHVSHSHVSSSLAVIL